MKDQIIAYYNEFPKEGKDLYFIQCGGLRNKKDEGSHNGFSICKTDWSQLLDAIVTERKLLNSSNPSEAAYIRVLDDIIMGLELFGYYRISWLAGLKSVSMKNLSLENLFSYAR